MAPVRVKQIEIGSGVPKVCVPIVGRTETEILAFAGEVKNSSADIVEWRADWYEEVLCQNKMIKTAEKVRQILQDKPLLFTFRTKKEGGERDITKEAYAALNGQIIKNGYADLVDVEFFLGEETVGSVSSLAREYQVKTVFSNHDFEKTPQQEEILRRLKNMERAGADIAKIAVMPQKAEDVLELLSATLKAVQSMSCPVITMSMGKSGMISRVCGEIFGSSVTFGSMHTSSAPGQIDIEALRQMLAVLHGEYIQ
ncbi:MULTISPECIES: type I 3-dehydroquinate dehydratase [Lachnospiraceae]|jgi:3-dehydroquinate dehydratase-1|uniref:3-dehydroquinate dehydratase n=1 Tax=Faecalicatena acetigenes TaxID=2981790 RepID=A0ABT2TBB0_9FIRM|nr:MULTISPECIES: type I 3-dehydroquinate dehydratase [Lachnospiraceae]MCU6747565.1 type I 3-dehydroquinate dehydratase [Faecalicatena acetigenes]RGT75171.1 type I 3-dehydroquinate dehydratase [Ruminococcus sp. AF18-22]SCH95462.1 3-dehydroquinate dehydratase [uncultured Clostridium sp.]